MTRKLASIQKVVSVSPHTNADSLELVQVQGWQMCAKKGEFHPGDFCVYVEIDSIMPDRPEFEFLRTKNFRIKTVKLRGELSQGICFPTSILPMAELVVRDDGSADYNYIFQEGEDMTQLLGVVKYEKAVHASLSGIAKGSFPSWAPKTDEERVQNLAGLLSRWVGTKCYLTEKLEGSSASFYLKGGVFGVCSRNLDLMESDTNAFWKLARQEKIQERLEEFVQYNPFEIKNVMIQGELIGEKIEENHYGLTGHHFRAFNVFDIDKQIFLGYWEFLSAVALMGLQTVPVLATDHILVADTSYYVQMANGLKSLLKPEVLAEGIVIRPLVEQKDNRHGRVSFKAISNEYILKHS